MTTPIIAALAGRRVDTPSNKSPRFPLAHVPAVRQAIKDFLHEKAINILICSAASGADLIALDVAMDASVRCKIVLPYAPSRFRETSVIDRPGDWGLLFDRIVASATAAGDLLVLEAIEDQTAAYINVNNTIIRDAVSMAYPNLPYAALVWDAVTYGDTDVTAQFKALALDNGFIERTILTC